MVDTPGFPDGNTCLMVDERGQLMLFWPLVLANTWESCVTQLLVSQNPNGPGAPQWTRRESLWLKPDDFSEKALLELEKAISELASPVSESLQKEIASVKERLPDKLYQRLGWQPRCKPTVLENGRIVLPLYTDTYSFSIMAISDDRGVTWKASEPLIGFGNIQPAVLERRDGTLVAYMRENGLSGKIRVCESKDQGETWGTVYSSQLPNPGSGLDAVRLASGRWVLIHNDTTDGRNRLALSYSDDEGLSLAAWSLSRKPTKWLLPLPRYYPNERWTPARCVQLLCRRRQKHEARSISRILDYRRNFPNKVEPSFCSIERRNLLGNRAVYINSAIGVGSLTKWVGRPAGV